MFDIFSVIPSDLQNAVRYHGFHKVAARMYGLDENLSEEAVFSHIGTKLAARVSERRKIDNGLRMLNSLLTEG